MMTSNQDDNLPISMLNQLEYCERRFYLMHVLGEMEINVHVLEGTLRHEQAHQASADRKGDQITHRRIYVWSEALGIAGFADVVEEQQGKLTPVEYKKGRMGRWLNDHIQLCAQALCLEERTGNPIERGYIFYFGSRRREEVTFTPELRQRTLQAVERARQIIAHRQIPPPLTQAAKCRDCSLEPVCLPRETMHLAGVGAIDPIAPAEERREYDDPVRD